MNLANTASSANNTQRTERLNKGRVFDMAENKSNVTRVNPIKKAYLKIKKFFKDLSVELKKVTWPTKKQVIQNTGSVLVFCFIVGAIIWISDFLLKALVTLIYG